MAIEPIKGFYVHDEATNTDGVAKVDYNNLANNPSFGDNMGTYPIVMEVGYYIECATGTVDINNKVANTYGFSVAVVSCSEGDVFTITAQGGNTPRAWAMIDASGNIIANAPASETVTDAIVVAQPNTAYIIINDKSNSISYKGRYIKDVVNDEYNGLAETMSLTKLPVVLEQGGLEADGSNITSNIRLRTMADTLLVGSLNDVYITFESGFKYALYFLDSNGDAIARATSWQNELWLTDYGTYKLEDFTKRLFPNYDGADVSETASIRVVVGKLDNSNISVSDVNEPVIVRRLFPKLNKVFENYLVSTTTHSASVKEGELVFGKLKANGTFSGVITLVFSLDGQHYTSQFNIRGSNNAGEYCFVLKPFRSGNCNFVYYAEVGTPNSGTVELWLSSSANVRLPNEVHTNNEVVVAPYGYKMRYARNIDYFCDGVHDEVEIQQAVDLISQWGRGTVKLLDGFYSIDGFTEYDATIADRPTAILIKGAGNDINIEGASSERGAWLTVTATALAQQEELGVQCEVFGATVRGQNDLIANYKNIRVDVADQNHPLIVFNNYYAGASKMESIRMYALGYGPLKMPVEGLIGIRCTRGYNNGIGNEMAHIGATGFYEGFQLGGEHLVAYNLLGRNCYYSYTFGNYESNTGGLEHPYTLINCADEYSACLPYFGTNGRYEVGNYANDALQQVDLIGFNMEFRKDQNPTGQNPLPAEEKVPGSFCGRIEFTATKNYYFGTRGNLPNIQFWKAGHGERFRTSNMTHRLGGTTTERNTYTPQYMQTYYDTTLNKMLVYDGTQWRDMNGTAV